MDSETSILETPVPPARPGLSWRGLIEVFYKPAQLFEELKQHPKILVPYVVCTLAALVSIHFVADYLVEIQIAAMKANENMNPAQIPSAEFLKPFMYIGVIFWALGPLLYAALAMLVGNFFMGGKASFKQLLSAVLYGSVVFTVGGLIMIPMMLAKGSLFVSIGPAALISEPSMTDPLYMLLTKFSLFYIWEIVVVGIGLSIMYGFSRNKGYVMAVCSLGLISLLHVLQIALFS